MKKGIQGIIEVPRRILDSYVRVMQEAREAGVIHDIDRYRSGEPQRQLKVVDRKYFVR